jgi:hypothetical protein
MTPAICGAAGLGMKRATKRWIFVLAARRRVVDLVIDEPRSSDAVDSYLQFHLPIRATFRSAWAGKNKYF